MGGAKLQQNSRQAICLPHGAALPLPPNALPAIPVEKDWGIKGGPASIDTLQKNLSGFSVDRDKAGQTTITFTARDPNFRIDYQLNTNNKAITAGTALTDAKSFLRTGVPGEYSIELKHNKDGSATYTLKLEKAVAKAAITLGNRKFLIDPEKLKTPPIKVKPLPAPAPSQAPVAQPDPGYEGNPEPAPKLQTKSAERIPAPTQEPQDPYYPSGKRPDRFEAEPMAAPKLTPEAQPAPAQEAKAAEKVAEKKAAEPAKALTAKEEKALKEEITQIAFSKAGSEFRNDSRARFIPVPELEGLVPKTAADRDRVIEPFKISEKTRLRGPAQNVYIFPTRNENGVAGMTMIPWTSVKDSLDAGRYPKESGAKQAINGAFVTIMNGKNVDQWWGIQNVPAKELPKGVTKLEGQVNSDASVSVRKLEGSAFYNFFGYSSKPSASGKIYRPEIDGNGAVSWKSQTGAAIETGRLAPLR